MKFPECILKEVHKGIKPVKVRYSTQKTTGVHVLLDNDELAMAGLRVEGFLTCNATEYSDFLMMNFPDFAFRAKDSAAFPMEIWNSTVRPELAKKIIKKIRAHREGGKGCVCPKDWPRVADVNRRNRRARSESPPRLAPLKTHTLVLTHGRFYRVVESIGPVEENPADLSFLDGIHLPANTCLLREDSITNHGFFNRFSPLASSSPSLSETFSPFSSDCLMDAPSRRSEGGEEREAAELMDPSEEGVEMDGHGREDSTEEPEKKEASEEGGMAAVKVEGEVEAPLGGSSDRPSRAWRRRDEAGSSNRGRRPRKKLMVFGIETMEDETEDEVEDDCFAFLEKEELPVARRIAKRKKFHGKPVTASIVTRSARTPSVDTESSTAKESASPPPKPSDKTSTVAAAIRSPSASSDDKRLQLRPAKKKNFLTHRASVAAHPSRSAKSISTGLPANGSDKTPTVATSTRSDSKSAVQTVFDIEDNVFDFLGREKITEERMVRMVMDDDGSRSAKTSPPASRPDKTPTVAFSTRSPSTSSVGNASQSVKTSPPASRSDKTPTVASVTTLPSTSSDIDASRTVKKTTLATTNLSATLSSVSTATRSPTTSTVAVPIRSDTTSTAPSAAVSVMEPASTAANGTIKTEPESGSISPPPVLQPQSSLSPPPVLVAEEPFEEQRLPNRSWKMMRPKYVDACSIISSRDRKIQPQSFPLHPSYPQSFLSATPNFEDIPSTSTSSPPIRSTHVVTVAIGLKPAPRELLPTPAKIEKTVLPAPLKVERKILPTPLKIKKKVLPTPPKVEKKVLPTPPKVEKKILPTPSKKEIKKVEKKIKEEVNSDGEEEKNDRRLPRSAMDAEPETEAPPRRASLRKRKPTTRHQIYREERQEDEEFSDDGNMLNRRRSPSFEEEPQGGNPPDDGEVRVKEEEQMWDPERPVKEEELDYDIEFTPNGPMKMEPLEEGYERINGVVVPMQRRLCDMNMEDASEHLATKTGRYLSVLNNYLEVSNQTKLLFDIGKRRKEGLPVLRAIADVETMPRWPRTGPTISSKSGRIFEFTSSSKSGVFLSRSLAPQYKAVHAFYKSLMSDEPSLEWDLRPHIGYTSEGCVFQVSGYPVRVADEKKLANFALPDLHNHRELRLGEVVWARFGNTSIWPAYIKTFMPAADYNLEADAVMIQWINPSLPTFAFVSYYECYNFDFYFAAMYNPNTKNFADCKYDDCVALAISMDGKAGYWEDYISRSAYNKMVDIGGNVTSIPADQLARIKKDDRCNLLTKAQQEAAQKIVHQKQVDHFQLHYKCFYQGRNSARFIPAYRQCVDIVDKAKLEGKVGGIVGPDVEIMRVLDLNELQPYVLRDEDRTIFDLLMEDGDERVVLWKGTPYLLSLNERLNIDGTQMARRYTVNQGQGVNPDCQSAHVKAFIANYLETARINDAIHDKKMEGRVYPRSAFDIDEPERKKKKKETKKEAARLATLAAPPPKTSITCFEFISLTDEMQRTITEVEVKRDAEWQANTAVCGEHLRVVGVESKTTKKAAKESKKKEGKVEKKEAPPKEKKVPVQKAVKAAAAPSARQAVAAVKRQRVVEAPVEPTQTKRSRRVIKVEEPDEMEENPPNVIPVEPAQTKRSRRVIKVEEPDDVEEIPQMVTPMETNQTKRSRRVIKLEEPDEVEEIPQMVAPIEPAQSKRSRRVIKVEEPDEVEETPQKVVKRRKRDETVRTDKTEKAGKRERNDKREKVIKKEVEEEVMITTASTSNAVPVPRRRGRPPKNKV